MVSAVMFVSPLSQVLSPPTYKPITFFDANRYEAWHGAMKNKIQVLRSNDTWSLVPFYLSINIVGSHWVYKIKHRVNGNIELYKA